MRRVFIFCGGLLLFVFLAHPALAQNHPCSARISTLSTCQNAVGSTSDSDNSKDRRWKGVEIYDGLTFSPPAIPPENNGLWLGKLQGEAGYNVPISLDPSIITHTIYALCRDSNRASHDNWGYCLSQGGSGVCTPDGGVKLTCGFEPTAPSNLRSACSNLGNTVTISWDPDTNPNLAFYSLRINADDNGNLDLNDDWDGSCSSALGPLGDRCLDIDKNSTSYSFLVDPNVRYNWWIHSRGPANEFGPVVWGPVFQCSPNCSGMQVNGPSLTFDAASGRYIAPVNTTVNYSANFESLEGNVGTGFFIDPVESGAQDFGNMIFFNGSSNIGNTNVMSSSGSTFFPNPGLFNFGCDAKNDNRVECRADGYGSPLHPYSCRGPNTMVTIEVLDACTNDTQAPPPPPGLNISCQYIGESAGVKKFTVLTAWNTVNDNGCKGMNSQSYFSQIGNPSNMSSWHKDSGWISGTTFNLAAADARSEGEVVFTRVRSRDANTPVPNISAYSPVLSVALNCSSCTGCPVVPPPPVGTALYCPR